MIISLELNKRSFDYYILAEFSTIVFADGAFPGKAVLLKILRENFEQAIYISLR